MNHRIKLFIGFLAFTAVVSVFSFFDVFNVARSLITAPENKPLAAPDEDVDHDGLLNADESYWNTDLENPDSDGDGFLDGEEVASSHDPTTPGPEDSLTDINLTNRLADLTLGGITEGDLSFDNPDIDKNADTLALSIIDDSAASFVPKQDISQIKTTEATKENQQRYLEQVASVWGLFYQILVKEAEGFESKLELMNNGGMANPEFIQYFSGRRDEFKAVAQEWSLIPVPKNWLTEHTQFYDIIGGFAEVNNALAGGKEDPLRATIGFSYFLNLIDINLPEALEIYSNKAKTENLSIDIP